MYEINICDEIRFKFSKSNNISYNQRANLRFKSRFKFPPKNFRSFKYNIYFFPSKNIWKIEFSIIEERKRGNNSIIKYKLWDKWIIERVGKLFECAMEQWPRKLGRNFRKFDWKRNLSGRVTGNNWKQWPTFTHRVTSTIKQSTNSGLICFSKKIEGNIPVRERI